MTKPTLTTTERTGNLTRTDVALCDRSNKKWTAPMRSSMRGTTLVLLALTLAAASGCSESSGASEQGSQATTTASTGTSRRITVSTDVDASKPQTDPDPDLAVEAPTTAVTGSAATDVTIAVDVTAPDATAPDPSTATTDAGPGPTLPQVAKVGLPPEGEEPRNILDQPVRLDETASLACAHAEFALEALDGADLALARKEVAEVAVWGAPSANTVVAAASVQLPLSLTDDNARAQVEGFLALCSENGHIL